MTATKVRGVRPARKRTTDRARWGSQRATAYRADPHPADAGYMANYRAARPVILSTGRGDVRLTPDEAVRLAGELVAAAGMVSTTEG